MIRFMKKVVFLLLAASVCICSNAAEYGRDRYELSVSGVYGFNTTWRNYGGATICGFLPVCKYFEADADVVALSSGTFSCSATARPKYSLPVGDIFLDGTVHYRSLYKYSASEIVAAASLGYRMDYFSIQAGIFFRTMMNIQKISEPLNILYKLSFAVRPASSSWNLGGGITDYSPFEYEREYQPIFFLDGYYRISPHFRINAEVSVKAAGMFHLVASFYGVRTSIGLSYIF